MRSPHDTASRHARTLAILALVVVSDAVVVLGPRGVVGTIGWWSVAGLAGGLLSRAPRRASAVVLPTMLVLGAGLRWAHGLSPGEAGTLAAVQVLQSAAVTLALTDAGRRRGRLREQADLIRLGGAGLAVGVISALSLLLVPVGGVAPPGQVLWAFAAAQLTSTLVLAAPVLLAPVDRRRLPPVETTLQVVTAVAAAALVALPVDATPLALLPVPVLVWAALRLDLHVVVWELVALAASLAVVTEHGAGPLRASLSSGAMDPPEAALFVQAIVLTALVLSLPTAIDAVTRVRVVRRLAADEDLFRRTFTDSPVGMLLVGPDVDGPADRSGRLVVVEVNAAAEEVLAAGAPEVLGARFGDLVRLSEPVELLAARLTAAADGAGSPVRAWEGTGTVVSRAGSRLRVGLSPLPDRGERPLLSVQLVDVTQEQVALRRLERAHQLNDATLDTTACVIMVADTEGTVVRVNAATTEVTGVPASQIVGRPVWDCGVPTLDQAETQALLLWPNRSGRPVVTERTGRRRDGTGLRVLWNTNVVRDSRGNPAYAVLTGIDVTAERRSTALVSHLLDASIATALIGVDAQGRVVLANAGAEHVLGYTRAELEGRRFTDLVDPAELAERTGAADPDVAFAALVAHVGDGETQATDWTWRTQAGASVIVSLSWSLADDDPDRSSGVDDVRYVALGRDVTEARAGQRTLVAALERERTAVQRLRALDRAKDEFVSTVSHELRTPVTSIQGYAEMLRDGTADGADPAAQEAMLAAIDRNASRLVALCNDLLVLSAFDSPSTSVAEHVVVDLAACVTAAEEATRPLLARRSLQIVVQPAPEPVRVMGDSAQLDRVVGNLLGNAIKFTADGGRVDVELASTGGEAVLTVRDTGMGIAPEDIEAVFQRFFRTESAQTQQVPGTGLGLSIVAAIVEAHQGRVEVDSTPGVGTAFRVVLPAVVEARRPAVRSAVRSG